MARVGRFAGKLLVALTVFVVAGELLARALDIVDRLNGYNRLLFSRGSAPDLPYRLRAGVETTFLGTPVRINTLGFRGPELSHVPAPGVRRVLMAGDSVVFGMGANETEMMSAVVQRRLNEAGTVRYETINAGIPGFDTVATVRLVESAGLELRPATIVVGVSLNDYEPAPAYNALGLLTRADAERQATGVLGRSEFILLLRWMVRFARGELPSQIHEEVWSHPSAAPGARARLAAAAGAIVKRQHLAFYRDPAPETWARIQGALLALRRIADTHRIPTVVVIFPEAYQVTDVDPDLTPQRRLLEACQRAGLHCIDLQPVLAAAGGNLVDDVQHPNAAGQAVAGAAIAAALLGGRGSEPAAIR